MKSSRLFLGIFAAATVLGISQDKQYDPSSFTWNPKLSESGPVVVSVNLKSQKAAVYRGGVLIGSCLVSTGRQGYETPTGVFHILEKDADHHSSKYNNASMPYTERLTWGGVALHAGGLPGYPSSHGCVHLPFEFSKKLFEITSVGTTVIVSNGDVPHEVSNQHRIEFAAADQSEMEWRPHDSEDGPVDVLYSSADKELLVVRNGVMIGKGPAHEKAFAKKPHGTYTYVCDGWNQDKDGQYHPHWHQVAGPQGSHELKAFSHIQMDPRLKHVMDVVMKPGTTLVLTDDSLSNATRSQPGFLVMHGGLLAEN